METGSLEELAARRKRALAKSKLVKKVSDEKMDELGKMKDELNTLNKKLQEYKEKKRLVQLRAKAKKVRDSTRFDEIYVDFMFSASALCLIICVAIHVFRLVMILVLPELLMECAIIVNQTESTDAVQGVSIAWQLLLGRMPCDAMLDECDECDLGDNSEVLTLENTAGFT
ncbi:uncharacterized protein LOC144452958 [Glandiceps talaboti]